MSAVPADPAISGRSLRRGADAARATAGRWPLAVAALVALPLVLVLGALAQGAFGGDAEVVSHLFRHVVPGVVVDTLVLVAGVALVAGLLGTGLAWLVSTYDFPLRGFYAWALLLPLAAPAYVLAFVAIAALDYAGPVQGWLRTVVGPELRLPPIRSTGGVILVMGLALYPYVYLLARGAFATQGRRALEVAQSLGLSPRQAFLRVQLPLARPWIAGGIALVAMETLADFGTVAVFNYDTFTTAIYRAWSGLYSLEAALQLAGLLVVLVAGALVVEQRARAAQRHTALGGPAADRRRLRGWRAALATAAPATVLTVALVLPLIALVSWSARHAARDLDADYFDAAWRSLLLGLMAAALVCALALALAYAVRARPGAATRALARLATLGYALPGAVLAVGVFVPVATLNNAFEAVGARLGADWPFYLQGTFVVLLMAYAARFLAVGHAPVEANLGRVTRALDDSARLLGASGLSLVARVHLPLLRAGLLTAAALVFVDVMKEMPITLMTRPFGWDTLAVRVFELTSEGEWTRAALPALAIVLAGLVPVALILRRVDRAA
ncbi:MAG: iron ABC transporter permease [Steroidobacteraceae bacterium]|jgi:iron(III) transport system permease protein|nr:iron ABC transporter permease [Steroidobacteraceae bacterium]